MRGTNKYIMPHRRKREGKTDYKVRLKLLKSRKPRMVVRKSLSNIICQIVKYETKGDKVIVSADSKELKNFGWKFHCGNTPAAYLTGYLCAERAKRHKVNEAVLDIGLYMTTTGNRLFSALKGAVDGGLEIPHSDEILPPQERFTGKHIADYSEKLKSENPGKYKRIFSSYLKNKTDPKEIPAVFEETKKKIAETKGEAAKRAHKNAQKTAAAHHHESK